MCDLERSIHISQLGAPVKFCAHQVVWGSLHRQMSHIKRIRLLLGSKPLADEYENDLADLAPLASYSSALKSPPRRPIIFTQNIEILEMRFTPGDL